MTDATAAWTCPFCPLSCDDLGPDLTAADCPRARAALDRFSAPDATARPEIDGQPATLDAALAAAAQRLAASRQPLMAGLGADVAGARALYPLACATGAISESAAGGALMNAMRALQDRGQFTTTLAEVRARGDVIVFIGGLPVSVAPRIRERLDIGEQDGPARHVVLLGPREGDAAALAAWQGPRVTTEVLALQGDLFDTVAWLDAALAGRLPAQLPPPLQALAARLMSAKYAVLAGSPPMLPAHGALVVEAVHRCVGHLNRSTRAAALWVGGGNGVATSNQVFAWLSGLPLRSRAGPRGLEHEPHLYDGARLLADNAVDLLLWVSCFEPGAVPPDTPLPLVALAAPQQAAACRRQGSVFIPVSTPGLGSAGHVFRTDGTVLVPLHAPRPDGLPTLADIATRLAAAVREQRA